MTTHSVDMLIVTVVWGEWHLNALLDLNLPTLLAPGNLPALFAQHRAEYQIHTRARDVERIRTSATFQKLEALVPVSFRIITDEGRLRDPIAFHVAVWKHAIEEAAETGRFALLMPPDVLWSDGSFAHVSALLSAGKRAIYMAFMRVASESFLPDFWQRFGAQPELVALSGNQLVEMSLEHAHPLMAAHRRTSRYAPSHTEMMIWPVPHEGLALRVFARELFVFDARIRLTPTQLIEGTVDPETLHMVADSDQLFAVSLAPLGKDAAWHTIPWQVTTLDVAHWWLIYDAPANDYVASVPVRWHYVPPTPGAWRGRELAGALFTRRAALEREALRLIGRISSDRHARATLVAQLLALCLLSGRVTRALRGLGRTVEQVFAFVPEDRGLQDPRLAGWTFDIARIADGRLERLVRDHVALAPRALALEDDDAPANDDIVFLSGRRGRLERRGSATTIDGIAITHVERLSPTLTLCYTSDVLPSDTLPAAQPPDRVAP